MHWFMTLPLQFSVCPDCAHPLHCPSLPCHLVHSLGHDLTPVSIPCLALTVLRNVSALHLKIFSWKTVQNMRKDFFFLNPWCPVVLSFMLSFWQHKYTLSRASEPLEKMKNWSDFFPPDFITKNYLCQWNCWEASACCLVTADNFYIQNESKQYVYSLV